MKALTKSIAKLHIQFDTSKVFFTIILMILWSISHTASMSFAKLISKDVHNIVLVFLRCLFGCIFFIPFLTKALMEQGAPILKTHHPFLQGLRIFFVCTAMACTYYTYRNLPIATATAIGFSSPLFTTLLASLFLKAKIDSSKWTLILLGYAGVIIILQPFTYFNSTVYIALLANLLASCSLIIVKKMSFKDLTVTIMFYTNLVTLILFSMAVPWVWLMPSKKDIVLIACLALSSTLAQFFYIRALRIGEPAFLSAFEYTRLLFAIISGYLFFNEIPHHSTLIGATIIVFSIFYLSRLELNKADRTLKKAFNT